MLPISGYRILNKIYGSSSTGVYRALSEEEGSPVILKVLENAYPVPGEIVTYKHEYSVIRSLELPGVIKAYALLEHENSLVLVLEDIDALSLDHVKSDSNMVLEEFLPIAIEIASSLEQIHGKKIIHRDVNPSNIIFHKPTGRIKAIDFGISTTFPMGLAARVLNHTLVEGTLPYISPEQTGRMNRPIDYRTDFYSLGVTFYELLTGRLPFDNTDPMEVIHAHMARKPLPPKALREEIPTPLSDIVMKLMAKIPEERYQSAAAIRGDLERCLEQFLSGGTVFDFQLGRRDISHHLIVSRKLYGREQETSRLMETLDKAGKDGKGTIVVSGYPGIGKTSLVEEIRKHASKHPGYFVSGKFDQFRRNIPDGAMIQALQELVGQILWEKETAFTKWRDELRAALGNNGKLITDLIPELETVIGSQPPPIPLPPTEEMNRFRHTFQNLVGVFAKPEHPVILFLDDLQWADSGSLELIRLIMESPDIGSLVFIGAYRDNEVSRTHPWMVLLNGMKNAGRPVSHISLQPLGTQDVTQLVADTLHCPVEEALALAKLVMKKTHGNPFFISEFLTAIHQKELLTIDSGKQAWIWNGPSIQSMDITENVVALTLERIQNLSGEAQDLLKLAACLGNRFDLKTLAVISGRPAKEAARILKNAVNLGIVLPLGDFQRFLEYGVEPLSDTSSAYRFSHDQIQQAAYSLIRPGERRATHWRIGDLLLRNTPDEKREETILDIVNQLNLGRDTISNNEERYRLARLNLAAGRKAKAASAYGPSISYFRTGIELVQQSDQGKEGERDREPSGWELDYDLTLALHEEAAESAFLLTRFEEMDSYAEGIHKNAVRVLDEAKVRDLEVRALYAQGKMMEALKIALDFSNQMGVKLPERPSKTHITLGILNTKRRLLGKKIRKLAELPTMKDPEKLAALQILASAALPAFNSMPELFPLIIFKGIHLSLRYGNTSESVFSYAGYGLILCGVLGDLETGYRFGHLALNLMDHLHAESIRPRTNATVYGFIEHWKKPVRDYLPVLIESHEFALEIGDYQYSAICAYSYSLRAFLVGRNLDALEKELTKYRHVIDSIEQDIVSNFMAILIQTVRNLRGKAGHTWRLEGTIYDMGRMYEAHKKANDKTALFRSHFASLMLCFLFGKFNQASEHAGEARKYLNSSRGSLDFAVYFFYDSLISLAISTEIDSSGSRNLLKSVSGNQKRLKKWAQAAPMNFAHKYHLIEAERSRLRGEKQKAAGYYRQAVKGARANGYINEEALANELAARFYLSVNDEDTAAGFMSDAHRCYIRWGAAAKAADLERRYFNLLQDRLPGQEKPSSGPQPDLYESVSFPTHDLDLVSALKASHAISGEIVMDRLIEKLMEVVLENGGGDYCCLILVSGEDLVIEAEVSTAGPSSTVRCSIPVQQSKRVPLGIINYVNRTGNPVILEDASADDVFSTEITLVSGRPKSILSLPISLESKPVGIIYLENKLATGAFTKRHLDILTMLSTQIAISLQNARLYKDIEEQRQRLGKVNAELNSEISRRKEAEKELARYRDHLEDLVAQRTGELRESQRALANLRGDFTIRQAFRKIIGQSAKMQMIYSLIEDLSDTPATVLITGESGTGKELVAEALHYGGKRRDRPFVKINCSALSETILESELFGHIRGAFTGATKEKIGRFQKAGDGTILLDEIGDISPYFQKRLLRVLQEREFERVGDTRPLKMNARVLAATNQELLEKVRQGDFREDLYYRLKVVGINLPPLRERKEDIPLLVHHFLTEFFRELNKEIRGISEGVLKIFMKHPWPGNIRELKNTLEQMCILCKGDTITVEDLPADFGSTAGKIPAFRRSGGITPDDIRAMLQKAGGNKTLAAKLLGISRRTLYRRLEDFNLQ